MAKEEKKQCYVFTHYTTGLARQCPCETKKKAREQFEEGICEVYDDSAEEEEIVEIVCKKGRPPYFTR